MIKESIFSFLKIRKMPIIIFTGIVVIFGINIEVLPGVAAGSAAKTLSIPVFVSIISTIPFVVERV